jgi:hypothetical protein
MPTPAETNEVVTAEAIIGESLKVFQDEGWTARDVADAIRSLRGLYLRENATAEGRRRWHGKVESTVVTTNETTVLRITTHEDGETFTDEGRVTPTAQSVQANNARLARPVMTNGVPEKLAAARLRRQAEILQGVSNVTVTVTAGQK